MKKLCGINSRKYGYFVLHVGKWVSSPPFFNELSKPGTNSNVEFPISVSTNQNTFTELPYTYWQWFMRQQRNRIVSTTKVQ